MAAQLPTVLDLNFNMAKIEKPDWLLRPLCLSESTIVPYTQTNLDFYDSLAPAAYVLAHRVLNEMGIAPERSILDIDGHPMIRHQQLAEAHTLARSQERDELLGEIYVIDLWHASDLDVATRKLGHEFRVIEDANPSFSGPLVFQGSHAMKGLQAAKVRAEDDPVHVCGTVSAGLERTRHVKPVE